MHTESWRALSRRGQPQATRSLTGELGFTHALTGAHERQFHMNIPDVERS
ncbi:hypothetical protein AB0383_07135 [Amycolatopsis sp. NPDC051373]